MSKPKKLTDRTRIEHLRSELKQEIENTHKAEQVGNDLRRQLGEKDVMIRGLEDDVAYLQQRERFAYQILAGEKAKTRALESQIRELIVKRSDAADNAESPLR